MCVCVCACACACARVCMRVHACACVLTSQGEQLQSELNGGDMLFQLSSTIPGVRRPNSADKSRSGSSTFIPSKRAIAVELLE